MRGSRRLLRRAGVVASVLAGLTFSAAAASADIADDFVDETLPLGQLAYPTNVEFAPDGRVFVAEKRGRIKVYDSINDPTPSVFADLTSQVHDHWDRGLLGLAVHPEFPSQPYVYALYTFKDPLDPSMPSWPGSACDNPPGNTDDGCVVSGRLVRLTADGNEAIEETVLINDWCQQFPSHSIGDLAFGPDGALYVTGGDGASFTKADYGQDGGDAGSPTPANPCGDPPVPVGEVQTTPTAEGGALRSQDLRTPGDPVTLDGTVIRINPMTGAALPDNPRASATDPNERRVVAYGLRNPFRLAIQPGSGDLYIGDVGWGTWEEVNVHTNPTGAVRNFGWPCFEGGNGVSTREGTYDSLELDICENLPSSSVTPSLFAYHHQNVLPGDSTCPPTPGTPTSSISGLAFYEGGTYPESYEGALFGSDYSRNCIWVMYTDGTGTDPSTVEVFSNSAAGPVELEIGPGGDLYYVDLLGHAIHRIRYTAGNTPPVAAITATPESGPGPLTVDFDASDSTDPDGHGIVSYEWDFDNDGVYNDASGVEVKGVVLDEPGANTIRLRVTDGGGETGTDWIVIQVSNTVPTAVIDSPAPNLIWHVGETINFSGHGDDTEDGDLPASAMTWELIIHHCEEGGSCHKHGIESFEGDDGSFSAPDHEYPSYLELRLTVQDQFGVAGTDYVLLDPEVVDLTFRTEPGGLDISFFGDPEKTPFTKTWIVGANVEVSTKAHQGGLVFQSWSNGQPRTHSFSAPSSDTTITAMFGVNKAPIANAGSDRSVNVNQTATLDGSGSSDPDGDPLAFSWSITSRPTGSSASLAGANTSKPKLTPDVAGTYKVRLQVSDGMVSDTDDLLVQVSEVKSSGNTFIDDDQSIFESSIEWMAAKGITKGCNPPKNDRFCPNDLITRAQMSAFFARAFGWTDDGGGNLFVDDDKSTFEHDIDLMGTAGVTRGCNPPKNDRFCPNDFVTREQMAAFFERAWKGLP